MIMFVIVVLIILALVIYNDIKKPKNYPHGPKWLPVIGNYTYFRQRLSQLGFHHMVWAELAEQYGNIVGLRMGRTLVVTVSGANAVKEVLTRDEFDGRPDGFFFKLRTFGKRLGMVFSDGVFWQKQRKFSMQHLRNFGYGRKEMEIKIEAEAQELIDSLRKQCHEPIEMHQAFDISVLNILWTMIAGNRFALDDERLLKLVQIIHDAFRVIDMTGGVLNQLPFLRYVAPNYSGYTQILDILNRLWTFLEETIEEHKKTICPSNARDLIDAFLQKMNKVQNSENDTFTDEQLLSLCLDLFMAGSETTSNTLSFAVLYMLKYPEIQKKVQNEMEEVVGGNRCPTLQDKIKMPYTEAVLNEIQRRANVPPLGVAHRAVSDTHLLGYRIPKGTILLTSLYSVHMDPTYWKDPQEFRPERFINEEGKCVVPEKHFAPFGYGKRRCLGESLAKANLFLVFTTLLYNFDLQKVSDDEELDLEGLDGVTICPKPFKAILTPRV